MTTSHLATFSQVAKKPHQKSQLNVFLSIGFSFANTTVHLLDNYVSISILETSYHQK